MLIEHGVVLPAERRLAIPPTADQHTGATPENAILHGRCWHRNEYQTSAFARIYKIEINRNDSFTTVHILFVGPADAGSRPVRVSARPLRARAAVHHSMLHTADIMVLCVGIDHLDACAGFRA